MKPFISGILTGLLWVSTCLAASASPGQSPISVVFLLKSQTSIREIAHQVSDPHSPRFGKPFSSAELATMLSPATGSYRSLLDRLEKRGFRIFHEDKIHQYLIVEANPTVLASTFQVQVESSDGEKRLRTSAPVIPADLSMIESIVNLRSRVRLKPPTVHGHESSTVSRKVATDFPSGLKPDEVNRFYGFDKIHGDGFFGQGEKIATVAFNAVNKSNVDTFLSTFGIASHADVEVVSVIPNHPAQSACVSQLDCQNEIENDLDLEMAARIAPKANLISFVGTTDDYLASWVAIFTAILDRGDIFIVNNSDDANTNPVGNDSGSCESDLKGSAFTSQLDPLFDRAVAQGVTIFSASGDNGSSNCGWGQSLAWPTGPNIVSVGGTDRLRSGKEIGWKKSGGGFSILYPAPGWQMSATNGAKMRGIPDIAFYAANSPYGGDSVGQLTYTVPGWSGGNTPRWLGYGGTSIGAPSMAGFLALVNEARHRTGKKRLPFLNPILYSMSPADYAACFNDIIDGSNGHYDAGKGWDAVTGLGSPKAYPLFKYLVNYR